MSIVLAGAALLGGCVFTDKATVVFPYVANGAGTKGTIFPLVWWEDQKGIDFSALYPLYSYEENPDELRFWALAGLCGRYRSRAGEHVHWILPAYISGNSGVYTAPYSQMERMDGVKTRAYACGVVGCTSTNGVYRSSWTFPLYYDDRERFFTPLFGKSEDDSWIAPVYYRHGDSLYTPLYSRYSDDATGEKTLVAGPLLFGESWTTNSCKRSWMALAGLVGSSVSSSGRIREHWVFPFRWTTDTEKGTTVEVLSIPVWWP